MASYPGGDRPRQPAALGSYARAVRAHALVVLAITAAGILSATAWLSLRSPSYTATAEILITPLPPDDRVFLGLALLRDSVDPTRTAQTAAALLSSPRAAVLTAQRMGPGFTAAAVASDVTVQPQGQSSIIAVSARADDPAVAAKLANTFATASLRVRHDLLRQQVGRLIGRLQQATAPATRERVAQLRALADGDDPTSSLSQYAVAPASADGAARWLVLALAAIAGFAIASAIALLMDLASPRLRDAQEIRDAYPLPVLARIPRLERRIRRRAGPLAPSSSAPEAYRRLQVRLDEEDQIPRTILVTSANSGDGKTSCAVNLALALVAAGRSVILLDFDLRKPDLGELLDVDGGHGLVSLLHTDVSLEDVLVPTLHLPSLRVAVAGSGSGDVQLLAALSRRAPEIIAQARRLADFVILDSAPLGEISDALRLIEHVDDVLLVARPGHTRRDSFEVTRELLEHAARIPTGLVLIRVEGGAPNAYYGNGATAADGPRRHRFSRLP